MTDAEARSMIDPEYIPAKQNVIEKIVDLLQADEDWYAEQDSDNSITISTPHGKFEIVLVESE